MFRLIVAARTPFRKMFILSALGLMLGFAAGQEKTAAGCPKDICEQDIVWDDCIDSPDPTSANQCNFVGGECHNEPCEQT